MSAVTRSFCNPLRNHHFAIAGIFLAGMLFGQVVTAGVRVSPQEVTLLGELDRAQLLVQETDDAGQTHVRSSDLTRQATYTSSDSNVVEVEAGGRLIARHAGEAVITVKLGDATQDVTVHVADNPELNFNEHVLPILTKAGCNAGACHASQYGKGGFILSVFGFDPSADRDAIVRDRQQRRVNFLDPERSLLLQKPTMQVPHGGSKRLDVGSIEYQMLVNWLKLGAPGPVKDTRKLTRIEVSPQHRTGDLGFEQQIQVRAFYADGGTRDVTASAKFDTMDDAVVQVGEDGILKAIGRGQAPVMVRYEGQAEICMVAVPYPTVAKLEDWKEENFVDRLAAQKFRELGITPSPPCDDATFVRRAFLDAIGTIPTPEEASAFIDSTDPDKRRRLVDRLLGQTGDPALDTYNDQYAAWWTLKWSDLIRADSRTLGDQGMWALHNWIRESFRVNRPFDAFVRELVLGKGSIYSNGPANYYRIASNPPDLAESTAQLFLGVRLQCAKCHHHPFEKYSQGDYYGFAAFFSRVSNKNSQEFGLFGRESVVLVRSTGEITHPRTGQRMDPTPLEGEPMDNDLDRRIPLAKWLTAKENRQFSKNVVNRYVGYLLGRGLVEEIDDMRATNPPTNVQLMDALCDDFIASNFDLKHLIHTIMTSRLYQLESQPTAENAADRKFYSHYKVKRISAEALLDAVDFVTGTQTKFPKLPLGTRAIELPDAQYPDYFLNTFAKPKRASVCECERSPDESLVQALHTLNGDIIAGKIADPKGRIANLLAAKKSHEEIVNELFLVTVSRRATPAEMAASQEFLASSPTSKECYEDLLWALINSKHFLFVR